MNKERQLWDKKYAARSHGSLMPDPFLVHAYQQYVEPLFPDPAHNRYRALDAAGGVGRHAIWLAPRGWDVTLVDISERGLALARENATRSKAELTTVAHDLNDYKPKEKFDLILVFFYLQRELFPAFIRMLKPEGLLIYKTYTVDQPKLNPGGGPTHPMHLLKHGELLRAFSKLRVLHYEESITGRKGTASLVGRK